MSNTPARVPPDHAERERALDAERSVLVRAPAGSGKTDLLTRRFLRLLAEVDEPGQIVAITFTKAAAAEMRNRILAELEKAAASDEDYEADSDRFSMQNLARQAIAHSEALGWRLLDLPALLRVSTIDSFCRDLALQQPLLSRLGGGLEISEQPKDLYRRAARRTLEEIGGDDAGLRDSLEALLLWRDNGWHDIENQLVAMLENRDRWMQEFVLAREPDWDALRAELERPFAREVRDKLTAASMRLDQVPGAREETLTLARFACEEPGVNSPWDLAQRVELPAAPFAAQLDDARETMQALARFLLTQKGEWRSAKGLNATSGFPATDRGRAGKARFSAFIERLTAVAGLAEELGGISDLAPAHYTDEDWEIVCASFQLLRHAAAQLKVVFAEAGAVDFIEVAQIAESVLRGEDGLPTEAAFAVADGIQHLLVDEFQDTSRRQHQLLARLIAAWPEREGRTCFVVGDPMQSIYFFRDADAELFPRVERMGLEIPGEIAQRFDPVPLSANFRTAAALVGELNETFRKVFEADDGSGVRFTAAHAQRGDVTNVGLHLAEANTARMQLRLDFMPQTMRDHGHGVSSDQKREIRDQRERAHEKQVAEIVALIRGYQDQVEEARAAGGKFRIAVLGRTKKALAPIASALRDAAIPFRVVDLEELQQRPEIMDALALARALLLPEDRVAWLGVLRAPWCGLSLSDLHALTSGDDAAIEARPVRELLTERIDLLSAEGHIAVERVLSAIVYAEQMRFAHPAASLGTWLEQAWLRLGGARCVDATERANLDLLWSKLDGLAQGEQDLLGPALAGVLESLNAQPDPAAESETGVQLMTIHKSKGLEFEVVIVPELQAGTRRGTFQMLSWLERGLPPDETRGDAEEASAITEFLVAPLQPKGKESGKAKKWVDRVRQERERQEMRRLLYVAATRAREKLHFFARPEFKATSDGALELLPPGECLLGTAWPAFGDEVMQRFAEWSAAAEPYTVESLAAAADGVAAPRTEQRAARVRRLPANFVVTGKKTFGGAAEAGIVGMGHLYERHEGGLASRALGTAVHALLQHLAQRQVTQSAQDARGALAEMEPRIAAHVRAAGMDAKQAGRITAQAMQVALAALDDPVGQWILAPHAEGASEVRWTGVVGGSLRTVQVDRVFRGGTAPQKDGDEAWWIIDYKTAHADGLDTTAALPELRGLFAPQIEAYAKVLRNLHGAGITIYAGLYYPRMLALDWWQLSLAADP